MNHSFWSMPAGFNIIRAMGILGCVLGAMAMQAQAQSLPKPSRIIYKCEAGGKIAYSDEPCLGAKRMDIEPTRGLNKLSGTTRTGADVQNEIWREQMSDAIRPLTGVSRKEYATLVHRQDLTPQAKAECQRLDQAMPPIEQQERMSARDALPGIQSELLVLRKRYKELRC